MAKLYFRYGSVGSAKTLNLLAVAHNYRQQNKRVWLLKPALDVRFGQNLIQSRAGLAKQADHLLEADERVSLPAGQKWDCVLVDEAQFLTAAQIEDLHRIAVNDNVPVICYGLRTDFRTQSFTGSRRLLELADSIEEVKNTCSFCDRKAIFNLKLSNGRPTCEGPQVDLGAEEKYLPTCSRCYWQKLESQMLQSPFPSSAVTPQPDLLL